ncbi:MAG: extracellular solute-binding protein [Oceanicoccus sp.]|uniref:extracellular solute-binding protein n=1 Tax=Oceanicoccus sp. TaxID=2691044 RepID=UPI0026017D24|nr:extracellular solute-binding protein [Oceanicoccus sp.]MCP3908937.1 extracellular solute-binding protein [Oceanicoccus sp.]MDG1772745.1 extracellular solute-binding protein [Oceanicoccus sp.]
MRRGLRYSLLSLLILLVACAEPEQPAPELLVYSARKEHLIKPLFDRFTEQTGVVVRYVTDKAGPLLTRLQAEGENSPADLLMTVDAGNLWQATEVGVLQPVESAILNSNVPKHLRGRDNSWFSLTIRARTMVYNTDTLSASDLSTYEALAQPEWAGRLCLRTSKKVYNQSLVATMIATLGEEQAEQVVAGWVDNLALDPFSNDTKVMEAVALEQCEVGIVNTYYYGRLKKQKPEIPLALFWPNQQGEGAQGRGVHVNVSGVGITRASQNKVLAQQLIEWLTTPEAQRMLMDLNQEYPVNPGVEMNAELQAWGLFKGDQIDVSEAGRLQAAAVKLMDRVGYR